MINLLPPSTKQDVALAKRNFKMFKFCLVLVTVIFGMLVITLGGLFYMEQSKNSIKQQNEKSQQSIENQNLHSVQKQAEEISGNIKLTTDVLSQQILFSKLIRQVGAVMPANTTLKGLSIGKADGGVSLTANAKDYNTASQIQVNLADPSNKIFDKADIINITCENSSTEKYPCNISVRARFNKENNFLFINPGAKK
jgi:hypothetical protein